MKYDVVRREFEFTFDIGFMAYVFWPIFFPHFLHSHKIAKTRNAYLRDFFVSKHARLISEFSVVELFEISEIPAYTLYSTWTRYYVCQIWYYQT